MPETKAEAFVRLAGKRVSKALNDLRIIKNLGKYPHTVEQTAKILLALRQAVDDVEYAFGGEKAEKTTSEFSL